MQQNLIHPINKLLNWLKEAENSSIIEPYAAVISTISNNQPRARTILIKEITFEGKIIFCTHLHSHKAQELKINSNCCLTFYWEEIKKQIRIEGKAIEIKPSKADEFFYARNYEKKLASITSKQSSLLKSYQYLLQSYEENKIKYQDTDIKRPDEWSGFEITPHYFEFFEKLENRLHKRKFYKLNENGVVIEEGLLYP